MSRESVWVEREIGKGRFNVARCARPTLTPSTSSHPSASHGRLAEGRPSDNQELGYLVHSHYCRCGTHAPVTRLSQFAPSGSHPKSLPIS